MNTATINWRRPEGIELFSIADILVPRVVKAVFYVCANKRSLKYNITYLISQRFLNCIGKKENIDWEGCGRTRM